MIDIKQTPTGDIDLSTKDIFYGESTEQHQRDILLCGKGHFKSSPLTGVDAASYLNDENPDEFLRAARKEFSRDGMKVKSLSVVEGELNVKAEYV
ncbi:hypothetical protein EZS27_012235 [termite gut metagenome]|uniref:Uncharacterized protein n=1 Tax=termite gut metagenome TaxID=433724 RepID=A0A5J4S343_9ZZZZ